MGNEISKINVKPSNYIQGNNQIVNYTNNSTYGNIVQVNNSVSKENIKKVQGNTNTVEELDFSINNYTNNNIPIQESDTTAQLEMLEQLLIKNLDSLDTQLSTLRGIYSDFVNAPSNSYPGLYFDGNKYLNPSEYAALYNSQYHSYLSGGNTNNLNTSGYAAINGTKESASSTINMMSIEEYEKLFNKYFEKTVGYDYNQYLTNLNQVNIQISELKASKYSIDQKKKQQPYLEMTNTKEYLDYVNENKNNTSFSTISLSQKEVGYYNGKHIETLLIINGVEVNPGSTNLVKIAMELERQGKKDTAEYNYIKNYMYTQRYQFLTENDKLMYSYLYDTKGKKAADDYLEAIKDELNRREGQASAEEFLKSITDENGKIRDDALAYLETAGKGFVDGIDNFSDGLNNVFATEGMMSANQYEQMYILQALTNSTGTYINELLAARSPEEAKKIQAGIYKEDGNIDDQFAKENLTEAEYLKLVEKIIQDKFNILDNTYQISTSIGNMAPSILVSSVSNILIPGSGAAVGSSLMGLSSGGNSLNQALIDGNDLQTARMYGILSGLSETTLGYLLGNIPGLSATSDFTIKGILKEGTEELLQEYVDAGLRATILGEHIDLKNLSQDAIKSFIYGCITSGFMNGGQITIEFSINGIKYTYDNINDFIDGMREYLPDDYQPESYNTQINDTVTQTNNGINDPTDDMAIASANNNTRKGITQIFRFSEAANLPDINSNFWTALNNTDKIIISIDGRQMSFEDAISYKKNYDLNMKDNPNDINQKNQNLTEENILLTESQIKVKEEIEKFDLEKFMLGNGASTGGIMLSTPSQTITTDCYVRQSFNPSYGEHGHAVDAVYSAIYENAPKIEGSYDQMWQDVVTNDGNICVQLCSGSINCIWIPNVISQTQYNSLVELNEQIKNIYNKNKEYFDNTPMEFTSNNLTDDQSLQNNFDAVLEEAKSRIRDVPSKEEVILGKITDDDTISYKKNYDLNMKDNNQVNTNIDQTNNNINDTIDDNISTMIKYNNIKGLIKLIKEEFINENYEKTNLIFNKLSSEQLNSVLKYFNDYSPVLIPAFNELVFDNKIDNIIKKVYDSDVLLAFYRMYINKVEFLSKINDDQLKMLFDSMDKIDLKKDLINKMNVEQVRTILKDIDNNTLQELLKNKKIGVKLFLASENSEQIKILIDYIEPLIYRDILIELINKKIDLTNIIKNTPDTILSNYIIDPYIGISLENKLNLLNSLTDFNEVKRVSSYFVNSDWNFIVKRSLYDKKRIKDVLRYIDNKNLVTSIEALELSSAAEIIKLLTTEQFEYVKNNLEGIFKNDLAIKYKISELYDARIAELIELIENDMIKKFSTTFGLYIPYERIQALTSSYKLMSKSRFETLEKDPRAMGYNDGKNSVINFEEGDNILILNIISHESIHHSSANDSNGNLKRGFSINRKNVGFNEFVTEYLNELVLGNKYYTKVTGKMYCGYQDGVLLLKSMIDAGFLNKEKLIDAYFKNDFGYIESEITKITDSKFLELLMKDFDDAISSDEIISENALKNLESKIEIMKQAKAGIISNSLVATAELNLNLQKEKMIIRKNNLTTSETTKQNISYYTAHNGNTNSGNILADIKRIIEGHNQVYAQKHGADHAMRSLLAFSDPTSKYYGNYTLISSNLGARNILMQYTPEQISHALNQISINNTLNKYSHSYLSGNLVFEINDLSDIDINDFLNLKDNGNLLFRLNDGNYLTYDSLATILSNSSELKRNLMASAISIDDPVLRARKLYIELNKKVHYSAEWIKASDETRKKILNSYTSFENLNPYNTVICKGWSELYAELLVSCGFDQSQVNIVNNGIHKWVEIDLGNGKILSADATEVMNGAIDLATCKAGMQTNGFMILDKNNSGLRLSDIYKNAQQNLQFIEYQQGLIKSLDDTLGYSNESGYLADQITKSNGLFSNSKLFNKLFNETKFKKNVQAVFDVEIPENMDGYELYAFNNLYKKKLLGENAGLIKQQNLYMKTSDTVEVVNYMSYFGSESGETIIQIYSKSLGKIRFNNVQEAQQYLQTLNLIK